jgi:hypothetical protein
LLTCPIRLSPFYHGTVHQGSVRASHACKLPIAPMGDSRFACCLQGGGVYVGSGTVTITSSSIYGNTGYYVRDQVQKFPSPRWENRGRACLDSRLYRSMFAGRRCLCLFRHGHDNVFLDLREYRLRCACSCSIVPIARCLRETHDLFVVCRAVVSILMVAQCQS